MKTSAMLFVLSGLLCSYSVLAESSSSSSLSSVAKRETECVYSDHISGWNVLDSRHVLIWSPTYKDAYLITLIVPLQDTTVSISLAFVDNDHDGMICGRSSDGIAVPNTGIRTIPSIISGMHRVDAAELQQLSDKYKVKLVPKERKKKVKPTSSSSAGSAAQPMSDDKNGS